MTKDIADQYPAEYAAFERYRKAKEALDAHFSFENGRLAKQAWLDFLNVYQTDDKKLYPQNVVAFPGARVVRSIASGPKGAA